MLGITCAAHPNAQNDLEKEDDHEPMLADVPSFRLSKEKTGARLSLKLDQTDNNGSKKHGA